MEKEKNGRGTVLCLHTPPLGRAIPHPFGPFGASILCLWHEASFSA